VCDTALGAAVTTSLAKIRCFIKVVTEWTTRSYVLTGIIHKSQASTTNTLAIGHRHIIDTGYAHTSPLSVSLAIGDFAGETLVRCCVQVVAVCAFLEVNAEVPHIERINALTFATN
jgi:hypothetical protein